MTSCFGQQAFIFEQIALEMFAIWKHLFSKTSDLTSPTKVSIQNVFFWWIDQTWRMDRSPKSPKNSRER